MTQNLDQIMQRTRRYWYEDGIAELVAGTLFCLGAVTLLAITQIRMPENLLAQIVAVVSIFSVVMVGSLGAGRVVKRITAALKDQITYPRTGYVEYKMPKAQPASPARKVASWLVFAVVTILVGAIVALVVVRLPLPVWALSMPGVEGLFLTFFLALLAYRARLLRFYVLAALSLGITALFISSDLGRQDMPGTAVFMVVMGILLFGSGAVTLARYLRET